MPTAKAINAAVDEIERILDDHPFAEANPQAMAALGKTAAELRRHDARAGELAKEICTRANLFYSRWSRARIDGGAVRLYTEMRLTLVKQLRDLAAQLVDEDS